MTKLETISCEEIMTQPLKPIEFFVDNLITQVLALRGNISENKRRLIAFSLTSIMQTAFLAGENSKHITGYNLTEKTERDLFISDTVSMLMEGMYE